MAGAHDDELERCEVCGFAWDLVDPDEVAPRILTGTAAVADALRRHPAVAGTRPEPGRWSALEYAAHLRDVLLLVRDRLVVTLVEDEPAFMRLFPDQRVDLGLYAGDEPDEVATELTVAAGLFVRTFDRLDDEARARRGQYTWPTASLRTITWMSAQVVHEVEHHGSDVDDVLATVGG